MQAMYATRLVATDDLDDSWDRMVALCREWAWRRSRLPDDAENDAGVDEAAGRRTRWSTQRIADDCRRSWRLEVLNPAGAGGVRYQAVVTVTRSSTHTSMFVSVGRLAAEGKIAPAPVGDFRRPGVVPAALAALQCFAGSQRLFATPMKVRAAGITSLAEVLTDPGRALPVIVVSTTSDDEEAQARRIADEVCGLAHVVELSGWLALDGLQARLPEARLPLRGARLFWPGDQWHNRWWSRSAMADYHSGFEAYLFQMLSRLSVVAHSRDQDADAIREAARSAERDARDRKLTQALAANDLQATINELQSALSKEREDVNWLLDVNAGLEEELTGLRHYKDNYEALAEWRSSDQVGIAPVAVDETVDFDSPDFSELWQTLEDQSDGAIVFTERAKSEWARCSYPYPRKMREALVALTRAAVEWRAQGGSLGMSLTSWLGDNEGLTYAPDDEAMRRLKIHEFQHDGINLNRLSHIKLDDHVSPDRVGRIYFGIDQSGKRWVVDHVGLKMHNVARS